MKIADAKNLRIEGSFGYGHRQISRQPQEVNGMNTFFALDKIETRLRVKAQATAKPADLAAEMVRSADEIRALMEALAPAWGGR